MDAARTVKRITKNILRVRKLLVEFLRKKCNTGKCTRRSRSESECTVARTTNILYVVRWFGAKSRSRCSALRIHEGDINLFPSKHRPKTSFCVFQSILPELMKTTKWKDERRDWVLFASFDHESNKWQTMAVTICEVRNAVMSVLDQRWKAGEKKTECTPIIPLHHCNHLQSFILWFVKLFFSPSHFSGRLPNTPIVVDSFQYVRKNENERAKRRKIGSRWKSSGASLELCEELVFFLSHAHVDHMNGLNSEWNHGRIYSTEITRDLVCLRVGA